jgi:hypothetical protein
MSQLLEMAKSEHKIKNKQNPSAENPIKWTIKQSLASITKKTNQKAQNFIIKQ